MKIKIAIADTNEIYARRLFEALQRQENLSLSVFTDKDKLEKDLSSARYDIILFDQSMYTGDFMFKNAKLSVLLFDEDIGQSITNSGKFKTVKKHQRGSNIYKEIIGLYSEFVSDSSFFRNSKDQCRVISVYSPVGGAGKTTTAMAIANSIANKGRNVIYLNFEPIASYGTYMKLSGGKGMGEIFVAMEGSGSFNLKLESLMKNTPQGIIYFEKFENLLDIYEITSEDIEKMIRMISKSGKADYIIIDMGTAFDSLNRSLMDVADRIVLVENTDKASAEKLSAFTGHHIVVREYSDKICSVINFSSNNSDHSIANYEIAGRITEKKADPEEVVSYISKYSLIDIDMIIS